MKNFLFLSFLLSIISIQAQHTISGTFSPAEEYTWLIAYHLKPGSQAYVADTAIKDGTFEMILPENSPKGTYRLVYAVPQERYNFDVIYTGKEDIEFNFDPTKELVFSTSKENILFSTYFSEIQEAQQNLIHYYTSQSSDMSEFKKIVKNYTTVQQSFTERSAGFFAQQFIKANRPYIPENYENANAYVKNRKQHYFDSIDLNSPVLQASGFLTDKLNNYVFTALPLGADDHGRYPKGNGRKSEGGCK